MSDWCIIPQTERIGRLEREVDCKVVRFFPKRDKKTGRQAGFGRLNFPVLQIVISNGHAEHRIVWSNFHNQPIDSDSPGKFTYHYAPKFERPKLKTPKGEIPNPLEPPRLVKGGRKEFECHDTFYQWLKKHRGDDIANSVFALIIDKMVEFEQKQLAKAA